MAHSPTNIHALHFFLKIISVALNAPWKSFVCLCCMYGQSPSLKAWDTHHYNPSPNTHDSLMAILIPSGWVVGGGRAGKKLKKQFPRKEHITTRNNKCFLLTPHIHQCRCGYSCERFVATAARTVARILKASRRHH